MQNRYDRCPNCMQALPNGDDVCPYCGFGVNDYEEKSTCLKPFTVLQNKYMIGRVIGIGGFGITYIGWDLNLQTYIAIKEYFPGSLASRDTSTTVTQVLPNESSKEVYEKGLKRYVEEAQNLSKFYQLQGIVSVKDFFYENATGYIVMEYINGINLKEYLNNAGGKLPEQTVLTLMKPVFESLHTMHNSGLVHRDISPDNIMVDKDNKIKLIDFGSARGQSAETDKTYTVILKHGYAPAEQYYAKGNQGPWTDIYSLCATMYKMLTGQIPPNSVERMEQDEYVDPTKLGVAVSQRTEAVLRKGLAVKTSDRYQNIGQLLADLYGAGPIQSGQSGQPGQPMLGMVNQSAPVATPAAFAATNPTQNSMHLSIQPQQNPSDKKKNMGLIIGIISAAIVALIVGLVLILGGGDKDKDKDKKTEEPTETTTEATSQEPDTTEDGCNTTETTTEAGGSTSTGSYAYEWPTEVSENWLDYTIKINDTIYKLPMPYAEFKSAGWEADYLSTSIAANTYDYTTFELDGIEMQVLIVNYGLKEAPVEECFVAGFSIDPEWYDVRSSSVIELSGGIKWMTSTEADIKAAFGAPDYTYDGEYDGEAYVTMDYADDEIRSGMDLEINSDGVLECIGIANVAVPEGLNVDASQIDTAPPEINSYYVAPTGPSTELFDHIVTINENEYYKLPVPVSEFTANGWTLDTATPDYISGNSYELTYIEKNGEKLNVKIENFTSDAILPINAYVTSISVDTDYFALPISFPGGYSAGDHYDKFTEVFGDKEDYGFDDSYTSFIKLDYMCYDGDEVGGNGIGYLSIDIYADPDTGVMNEIRYSLGMDSIEPQ